MGGGSIKGVGPPEEGGGSLAPPLSENRGVPGYTDSGTVRTWHGPFNPREGFKSRNFSLAYITYMDDSSKEPIGATHKFQLAPRGRVPFFTLLHLVYG